MSGRAMAFLDSNIPLRQVLVAIIAIGGTVFSLGQIQQRFKDVESTITVLVEDEENMATKQQLEILEQRLDKKIQILNDLEETMLFHSGALEAQIHELELGLQELRIKFEEHTH